MHINENITHRSTTSQTNIGMITMQFSRSHGQPLQKPQEMQQMLRIFVCRSLVFHKHDAIYMTYVISLYYGNFRKNGTKQLGTIMPCMTHDNSFYYGKFHTNGTKKLGTMMVCITYVISFYFGNNTSSCIVLHNLQSYCFVLHHLASSCIILHHIASSCIALHRLASPCIVLHCLAPSCIILHHLALSCIVLHHLALSCIILHHLASPCTVLHFLTMQFSRSHGQLLQKPQEMQQMLGIFVCRSLVFHKHDAMYDICHFILLWKFSHK